MSEASKPKWTPGPWHCWSYTDVDGDPRLDGRAYECHMVSFRRPIDNQDGFELGSSDEAKANAHLIAAAPELAEAIADIIEQFEATRFLVGPDLSDSIRVFGKKALAKARGEQS